MGNTRPTLGIVGHLASLTAYASVLNQIRGTDLEPLPESEVGRLLVELEPMPFCDVRLRSSRGSVVHARYVDLGLLIDDGFQPRRALERVRKACACVREMGARLGALGGFSSIIGEAARLNATSQYGLPFTTGNTLTAAVIARQIAELPFDVAGARVAVVGAAGDVGSGLCRILFQQGARLSLVGRSLAATRALAHELRGANCESYEAASARADILVLVASVAPGELPLDAVNPNAVVLDAGHPPNGNGNHAHHFIAGRVVHEHWPEFDLPAMKTAGYEQGESHACLAEAEVLAFEQRWEPFSGRRGGITPARAREIEQLALAHGITAAPLRPAVTP